MQISSQKNIGIVAYGVQLPPYKILGEEIARANNELEKKIHISLGVTSKTVPGKDEDTITLSTAAAFQALQRLQLALSEESKSNVAKKIQSLYIGSESHPYAVKPSGSVVAQTLGISSDYFNGKPLATADLQFACKAGTQALQIAALYVLSGFGELSCAVGADTAQSRPGDVLEYTAGAGAASFVLGRATHTPVLAQLLATTSVATDTPDFWRRPQEQYPQHAGRFTGQPGYFYHIELATNQILSETGLAPSDFGYCVFHTPNGKFPKSVAQKLGFTPEQLAPSLVVEQIGNTYAAASMIGLVNTLDVAKPDKKILVVSYGSGAGSDAFIFQTTQALQSARKQWKKDGSLVSVLLSEQINKLQPVSYQNYLENSTH